MDSDVTIRSDKQLQRNLRWLSKHLTGFLIQRMSSCLCHSSTITEYEAQVVKSQTTDVGKASKLMEIVIKKGRRACSSFLSCLCFCEPELYKNLTGYPELRPSDHHHSEDITISTSFPNYVINIQNSSLLHCIFGNNNSQCSTCDEHSHPSQSDAIKVDKVEDVDRHDQPIQVQDQKDCNEIQMERSHVEYVIIGDYNSMNITETLSSEDEEDPDIEPDENV